MEQIFDSILVPYMSSMPEFTISALGFLGTLACIVPEESKIGRVLGKVTGNLTKFKNYLLKKLKK